MQTVPSEFPEILPRKESSDEVQLALRVLKRKWDELSVEDARALKIKVLCPCFDRLKYIVIECVQGKPINDGHMGHAFLICLRLDIFENDLTNDRAKYKWLLQAFRPDLKLTNLRDLVFRIHATISKDKMIGIMDRLEPFQEFKETCVIIHSDWSCLPALDVLQANWEKQVEERNVWMAERREYYKGYYPKTFETKMKKECDLEWSYFSICDALGIENYPTF